MNVLFLGNSLIYYNDLPKVFEELARAAGKVVSVYSVTHSGATISDFTDEATEVGAKALPMLRNMPWDYVIIEPSRRITPFEDTVRAVELASAKKIQALARAAGGDVLLYSVWGNNNGKVRECKAESPIRIHRLNFHPYERKPHTAFMQRINAEFALELGGVKIAEAGYAFENLLAAYPDVNPYYQDERHPSPIGTYLAACVIFGTVFGERVNANPYDADLPCAALLRDVADATVHDRLIPDLSASE